MLLRFSCIWTLCLIMNSKITLLVILGAVLQVNSGPAFGFKNPLSSINLNQVLGSPKDKVTEVEDTMNNIISEVKETTGESLGLSSPVEETGNEEKLTNMISSGEAQDLASLTEKVQDSISSLPEKAKNSVSSLTGNAQDLASLTEKVQDSISSLPEKAKNSVSSLTGNAQDLASLTEKVQDSISSLPEKAKNSVSSLTGDMSSKIQDSLLKENPKTTGQKIKEGISNIISYLNPSQWFIWSRMMNNPVQETMDSVNKVTSNLKNTIPM